MAGGTRHSKRPAASDSAQIKRDAPIIDLELFELIFPISGAAANTMNEQHGWRRMPVALLRPGIDHAYFQWLAVRHAIG
jgi:hypothetical protein